MAIMDACGETGEIGAIEIAPMRDVSEPPRIVTIRPAKPGETPDLWCVIARMKNGLGRVLRDEREHDAALNFARSLQHRLQSSSAFPLPDIVEV